MYGKFSSFLIAGLLVATASGWAQSRPQPPRAVRHQLDRAVLRAARPVRYELVRHDAPGPARVTPAAGQNRPQSATPGSWGTLIGQSTYDLQSNGAMPRRVALSGNTLSAVWTQTCVAGTAPAYPNRGIGYNLSANAGTSFVNGSTGNCPSNYGIADTRTGWPDVVHVNGFELVAAHTGASIVTTRRPLGSGGWPATTPLAFTAGINGTGAAGTWPRLAAGGNTAHLIYCSNDGSASGPQAPSGVENPMLYARSTDAGLTWDRQNVVLPGMSAANFTEIGGDRYTIDANGSTVAIAAGGFGDHLVVWKSIDNGATFTARVVINDYTNADTIDIDGVVGGDTATVIAPDASMSVVVDNSGKVHWFSGTMLMQVTRTAPGQWRTTGNYFPNAVRELWYWNDGELINSVPQPVAQVENFVPSGAPFPTLATGTSQTADFYVGIGPASMPTTAVDANGDVYVIYAGGILGTSNDGTRFGQFYRDLYVQRLSFPGNGLVQTYVPKNISRDLQGVTDGAASLSEESVFPSAYRQIVNGKLHYQWMSDFEPGTALLPSNSPDPEVQNAIMHDALDVMAINWTPGVVLVDASCVLQTPSIVANSPACGGTLSLSATNVPAGATYQWSGPNGFTSTAAAPQIANVTGAATGSYQLTIQQNGCLAAAVRLVSVTLPSAAFSYGAATYCRSGANPTPAVTGAAGGAFTAAPAGLAINPATGLIDLNASAPGTYTVTYTVGTGACQATQPQTITLVNAAQAGFSYPTPAACVGAAATLTPTAGAGATLGTFTSGPAGLVISPTTGVVNLALSQPGTYTITNSVAAAGACAAVTGTTTLTLQARPTATITPGGATTFCRGGSVVLTASGGTTYQWSNGAATPSITVSVTGTYSVIVGNGTCSSAPASVSVTAVPAPATPLIAITPAALVLGQSATLAVAVPQNGVTYTWTGPGLPPAGTVGTSIGVTPPTAGPATYVVTAASGACQTTAARTVTVASQPVPVIRTFTPAAGAPGSSVTLFGSGFSNASALLLNGAAISGFAVTSDTTLTLTIPTDAASGKFALTTPGGSATSVAPFRVLPLISSFAPAAGAPGTVVTISGLGLSGTTAVRFGTASAAGFTVINGTTLTAIVPPNAITGKIGLTTTGGGALSATDFTVAPIITGFVPAQGVPGSVVLVQGLNFTPGTTVQLNGVSAPVTYNYGSLLTAVVPAGATTGPVTATNAAGTGTSPAPFTVTSGAAPTITSFSPTASVIVGTAISIAGTNFTGATLVRFNVTNATSFTVNSATSITAVVPAGATSGRIYVATPSGMAQSAGVLRIVQPPVISGFAPASARVDSLVNIIGSNFTDVTSVRFGTQNTTAFTVVSGTRITVAVPVGATTGPVQVTNAAGTATSAGIFTVLGPRAAARPLAVTEPVRLNVFPNPATEWLMVRLENLSTPMVAAELLDNLGRVVLRQAVGEGVNRLELPKLSPGLYVLRVAGRHQRLQVE